MKWLPVIFVVLAFISIFPRLEAYGREEPQRQRTPVTARSARDFMKANRKMDVIIRVYDDASRPLRAIGEQKFESRSSHLNGARRILRKHARSSQERIIELLDRLGYKTSNPKGAKRATQFSISNSIHVDSITEKDLGELESHPDVRKVEQEMRLDIVVPTIETHSSAKVVNTDQENWGIKKMGVDEVWGMYGNTGDGITVGVIDSGVDGKHEALSSSFAGEYGWHDPQGKLEPYDESGHGTHVTGIITGENGIGVAPGAKWMACKGCRSRSEGCLLSDLLECFEWMSCPTKADGTDEDCSKAPHVINNSWGGGRNLQDFDDVIEVWHALGIIPIFAAGNTGPRCNTVTSPGDKYNVITVGATDSNDQLARFSSKGTGVDGIVKPDIVAPGRSILSSCLSPRRHDYYCLKSGTSMATPQVSGLVALYLQDRKDASYDEVRDALLLATVKSISNPTRHTCGAPKTPDDIFPNQQVGNGRIDAVALINHARAKNGANH